MSLKLDRVRARAGYRINQGVRRTQTPVVGLTDFGDDEAGATITYLLFFNR
jgi:hypothetical protein